MSTSSTEKSYKESLKATALFGGVQVFTILIGVIRSKFVAVVLGPEGIGIVGLLTSSTGLIASVTGFSLGTSAVKDISEANGTGDNRRIAVVIQVFRRLVWLTGLLGAILCIVLSPLLSQAAFGNKEYTLAFIILSATLLFQQLSSGQNALLQGMRRYRFMARSTVLGNVIGLFTTVPLYYLWGIDAIVPVLMATSITSLALSYYFSKKIQVAPVRVGWSTTKREGKSMLKFGFFLSLQGILGVLASYLVRMFISNHGSISDVGLFTAGFTIVDTYVGLLFTAMSADYYPRLAETNKNPEKFNTAINDQLEIGLLLLSPVIASFIIFIKPVITLLYSDRFLAAEEMIYWAIFAIFFKCSSWAIAFSFLAKSDTKAYSINETIAIVYMTALKIGCYYLWGLTGLGISFLIGYLLYLLQVGVICRKRYSLCISSSFFALFGKQLALAAACILLVVFAPLPLRYGIGSCVVLGSFYYSYYLLNKRINITAFIKNKFKKNEHR